MAAVRIARIYDPVSPDDGRRVLVDRLWPRGVSKEKAALDEWCRDAAPSPELRRWFGHDPERFEDFVRRYRAELSSGVGADAVAHLRELAASGPLTLLTATRDTSQSTAGVLAELLAWPDSGR
ncbi:MAG: DUF488 domain-containing protein [Angustibacter sp.]